MLYGELCLTLQGERRPKEFHTIGYLRGHSNLKGNNTVAWGVLFVLFTKINHVIKSIMRWTGHVADMG